MPQFCPVKKAEVTQGQCNECNIDLVKQKGVCCDHISCVDTCDWDEKEQLCPAYNKERALLAGNPYASFQLRSEKMRKLKDMPKEKAKKMYEELKPVSDQLLKPPSSQFVQRRIQTDYNNVIQKHVEGARFEIRVEKVKEQFKYIVHCANDEARIALMMLQAYEGTLKEKG
jgi:hypothetical protein